MFFFSLAIVCPFRMRCELVLGARTKFCHNSNEMNIYGKWFEIELNIHFIIFIVVGTTIYNMIAIYGRRGHLDAQFCEID